MQTMRRFCVLTLVFGCALAVAAPAFALPHLSKSRTREIATLVDRFVNDLVLRKDIADGWKISGPDMRGAIPRKVWMSGKQLPVQQLDILNDPRTAWYAKWKMRTEIGLVLSLRVGHGKDATMYQDEMVLLKQHGRWVVDSFYTDGIFRLGKGHTGSCVSSKCKVTGIADYAPSGRASGVVLGKPRVGRHWGLVILLGIAGLPAVVLLGMGAVAHLRNRRARAAYLASRSS